MPIRLSMVPRAPYLFHGTQITNNGCPCQIACIPLHLWVALWHRGKSFPGLHSVCPLLLDHFLGLLCTHSMMILGGDTICYQCGVHGPMAIHKRFITDSWWCMYRDWEYVWRTIYSKWSRCCFPLLYFISMFYRKHQLKTFRNQSLKTKWIRSSTIVYKVQQTPPR